MNHRQWERIWHLIRAVTIILLLITGFEMHYPERLDLFKNLGLSLRLHIILGVILAFNELLSLLFNLITGSISRYIPDKNDLLHGAMRQARYYVWGIFQGEARPYPQNDSNTFNPLQRMAYFNLFLILIPLQISCGLLLSGATYWPLLFDYLGGFHILASLHTLWAFFFLSFLIIHLYLSTTIEDVPLALFMRNNRHLSLKGKQ